MNSPSWILILLIVAGACTLGGIRYGDSMKKTASTEEPLNTEAAYSAIDKIVGQGNLQPARGTINIVAPPGERIDELPVKVGQVVKKDDPLAVLASRKVREIELELAKSRNADAGAQADMLSKANQMKAKSASIAGGEVEEAMAKIENQKNAMVSLEASVQSAQKMMEKLTRMRANPVTRELVGTTEIETQKGLVNKLTAQLNMAKGEIDIASQAIKRSRNMAGIQMELAEMNADAPRKSVPQNTLNLAIKAAEMALDATTLKSPVDGRVLDLGIYQGDTVMNRPIMLIADTTHMICVAEIADTQLKNVKLGQSVTMLSEAFEDGEITGRVLEVGNMIAPPSMKDPNPFAAVDRKTGTVKIEVDQECCEEAGRFVNLQVEVRIDKKEKSAEATSSKAKPDKKTDGKEEDKTKVDAKSPAPAKPGDEKGDEIVDPVLDEGSAESEPGESEPEPILELSN